MSHSSKPDGTDPRIVTPDADEETVTIAHGYSTGGVYHTSECPTIKRMDDPHEVAKSVAEWKDYTKCKRCKQVEGEDGYAHPGRGPTGPSASHTLSGVSPVMCIQLRALLLDGASQSETAAIVGVGGSTVGRHARGECECDHNARQLTFDGETYHPVGEGVPKHITGYAPIKPAICATVRRVLPREGVSAETVSDVLDVSHSAVRDHARGECAHDIDTPALTFDHPSGAWVPVEDRP